MAPTVSSISPAQVDKILNLEEGHFIDVKACEIQPSKLTRSLSALANADGGELYIGISEDHSRTKRRWQGFARVEDANGHLQAFGDVFPLGEGLSYAFLNTNNANNGLVLQIQIQKTANVRQASDGIPYIRNGAQNIPVKTPDAIEQLRRNKGITSFESEPVAAQLDVITNSLTIIGFLLEVVPTAEPELWLRKQALIVKELPTVAGLMLFADEPQAVLPKRSSIKIYRYKATTETGSRDTLAFDPITIEGGIYNQIRDAVKQTLEVVQSIKILTPSGLQPIEYPTETLHEIITNAVLHRDYSIADDVHVRIFDNRIEIESPGRLPAHVTPQNILSERFARNGSIVRLINKFPDPPNKDVGEGLNTAFEAMKKLQLKPPVIQQTSSSVRCVIRHERLASPEELIMEYLTDHEQINNRTVRELTGIGSENKVKVIFQRLMTANQIERVAGPGKGGGAAAYRKAGN